MKKYGEFVEGATRLGGRPSWRDLFGEEDQDFAQLPLPGLRQLCGPGALGVPCVSGVLVAILL